LSQNKVDVLLAFTAHRCARVPLVKAAANQSFFVLHCRPNYVMTSRQSGPRFPSDHPAKIRNLDSPESPSLAGTILEFSEVGLRLRTRFPMPRGANIQIEWERGVVTGEIRYCRRTGRSTFHLGVTIAKSTPPAQPSQG
jgi:PilZ domain-containing protein